MVLFWTGYLNCKPWRFGTWSSEQTTIERILTKTTTWNEQTNPFIFSSPHDPPCPPPLQYTYFLPTKPPIHHHLLLPLLDTQLHSIGSITIMWKDFWTATGLFEWNYSVDVNCFIFDKFATCLLASSSSGKKWYNVLLFENKTVAEFKIIIWLRM